MYVKHDGGGDDYMKRSIYTRGNGRMTVGGSGPGMRREGMDGGTSCFRKVNLSRVHQVRLDNGFLETEENTDEQKRNESREGDAPNYLGENLRAHTIFLCISLCGVVGGKRYSQEYNGRGWRKRRHDMSLGGKNKRISAPSEHEHRARCTRTLEKKRNALLHTNIRRKET